MNQVFISSFRQNIRTDYMKYEITEAPPPPATQNLASVELRLLQLEQLASTLPPPQPAVASLQGVSQVGVHPQYTNTNNSALQRLKE